MPAVLTEIFFDHQGSADHTIIEVFAEDRFGLLFTLASALHELALSISVAKVSTEGTRAIDVFYVVELDGSKVSPGTRSSRIREVLLEKLDQFFGNTAQH